MRTKLMRVATGLVALVAAASVAPLPVLPQTVTPAVPANAPPAQLSEAALDQLLAPIALYPDQLLGQILMASTYPLEAVQAARWVTQPQNAALRGDALAAALQPVDWDPSVKALVPFPQILRMMDQHLDWLQNLGDAFLAQQDAVMESVQRLRRQAAEAGNLRSTPQQIVTMAGPDYVVQPANPAVVYVPVYNPTYVYGLWRYPLYPPFYFAPLPGFYAGPAIVHGIGFSIGFTVVRVLWGWDSWDWRHHVLHVDHQRYNGINRYFIDHARRPSLARDVWRHEPYHRRGVSYRSAAIQQHFRPSPPALAPDRTRAFRGYESKPPAAAGRSAAASHAHPAPAMPHGQAAAPRAPQTAAPRVPAVAQPHVATRRPAQTPRTESHGEPPRAAPPRQAPPAFQSFGRGAAVRAEAQRGHQSRQATAPSHAATPKPSARAPAHPGARPAQTSHGGGPERHDDRPGR
jgi:hypothetical protein